MFSPPASHTHTHTHTHTQLDQRREISSTVNSPQSPYVKEMRSEVKQRLLLIPIVFILLRMWGTIQFFYSLAASSQNHNGCIPPLSRRVFLALAIVQVCVYYVCPACWFTTAFHIIEFVALISLPTEPDFFFFASLKVYTHYYTCSCDLVC